MIIDGSTDSDGVVHVSVACEIDMATAEGLKDALYTAITRPDATRV